MSLSALTLALLLTLSLFSFLPTPTSSATFNCSAPTSTTCHSLIAYIPPNSTTLNSIKTLFKVNHFHTLLGTKNYPLATDPALPVPAGQKVIVPFTYLCRNGTGVSNKRPQYIVKSSDNLDHIATVLFSRFVTYQEITTVNKISDPSLIRIGQKLWIPLPCSWDVVDGERVVHYGHVVAVGSSMEAIATKYGMIQDVSLT